MDDLLDTQQPFQMQAPVTAAAKGCNKTLIIRQRTEPDLPRLNFTCLINPEVHHLLMQGIKIPTLLISNATRPIEKSIELKRTKTLNPEPYSRWANLREFVLSTVQC